MDIYTRGWACQSISNVVKTIKAKYALITRLDSDPNPAVMLKTSPELKSISNAKTIGNAIFVPTRNLTKKMFHGFDEIWFFNSKINKCPQINLSNIGKQKQADKIIKWMEENSCVLVLSDGDGMHYIVQNQFNWSVFPQDS